MGIRPHNVLALSDLHLGSDLVSHACPSAPERTRASVARDRELSALLDWYREHRVEERPWRLVIGGDFIDFSGMSVMELTQIVTEPTAEERAHGLGGAADHSLFKLRLVMAHHAEVMRSLAAFVAAGNELVIVPGNHDSDWHWPDLHAEFRRALAAHAAFLPEAVRFAPWFYYEEGLVYVEHGHQYDAYCSHDHVLYPVSPGDPRRMVQSISDVLVRFVVRPTRGMSEAGHERRGLYDYFSFAASLGLRGMLALARRFLAANRALLSAWHARRAAARRMQREHRRRMRRFALAYRLSLRRLRALARLHRPPITASLPAIATSLMLDRLLLLVFTLGMLGASLLFQEQVGFVLGAGLAVFLAFAVLRKSVLLRHTPEPSAELRERAAKVARLFPAAVVVMGHTHLPEVHQAAPSTTYVNLGAWAEEESADGSPPALPATRTHLVLVRGELTPKAELLTWDAGRPRPFARLPALERQN